MHRSLKSNGYPNNPRSFFVGIRREIIQIVNFVEVMNQGLELWIPVRFLGEWNKLKGVIQHINQFPDGMVVHMKMMPTSLLEAWDSVEIWIPRSVGQAGVLN
jgi:hypothetical protein